MTESLQLAPPPAATPATEVAPFPPAAATIADPDSFISALIACNFNFPALSRTIPAATLLELIRSPEVLAAIDQLRRLSAANLALREAHLRDLARAHLATFITTNRAAPTPESRRAANAILFGNSTTPRDSSRATTNTPRHQSASHDHQEQPKRIEAHQFSEAHPPTEAPQPSESHQPPAAPITTDAPSTLTPAPIIIATAAAPTLSARDAEACGDAASGAARHDAVAHSTPAPTADAHSSPASASTAATAPTPAPRPRHAHNSHRANRAHQNHRARHARHIHTARLTRAHLPHTHAPPPHPRTRPPPASISSFSPLLV